jgi:hypothetical protein
MRFFFVLSLLGFTSLLTSQQKGDYLINLNKDTVYVKVLRLHKNMRSVLCQVQGKKIKYEAKFVQAINYDSILYETGCVRLKRRKQFVFLHQTLKGKLNLYEMSIKKTKVLWDKFAYDFIRLRWVYRAQDWAKKYPVTVYFYKKENETRDHFSKSWKEKTKECKVFTDKLQSKEIPWLPSPIELVKFYNKQCH